MLLRRIDMGALFLFEQWSVKCKGKIHSEFTICFNWHHLVFFRRLDVSLCMFVCVCMCVTTINRTHFSFAFPLPKAPHPISICNMKYHALTLFLELKFNVSILCEVRRQIDSLEMVF